MIFASLLARRLENCAENKALSSWLARSSLRQREKLLPPTWGVCSKWWGLKHHLFFLMFLGNCFLITTNEFGAKRWEKSTLKEKKHSRWEDFRGTKIHTQNEFRRGPPPKFHKSCDISLPERRSVPFGARPIFRGSLCWFQGGLVVLSFGRSWVQGGPQLIVGRSITPLIAVISPQLPMYVRPFIGFFKTLLITIGSGPTL